MRESRITPASPAPRPHPQAPAVPCVSNPFSPLLREEVPPLQLKGDKRDSPSLGVSLPLCPTPVCPPRRDGMIRGPDWEDVERGQGHSRRLTMRVDTAARALEKVLGSPNAMSTQGQQGAPQGGRVRQSWTARAVTAPGHQGAAQRPHCCRWSPCGRGILMLPVPLPPLSPSED